MRQTGASSRSGKQDSVLVILNEQPCSGKVRGDREVTEDSLEAQTVPSVRVAVVASDQEREEVLAKADEEFVLLLESGDWLEATALAHCLEVLDEDPEVDVLYTDHATWCGSRRSAVFEQSVLKPAWSPELLRSSNYLGPLCLLRRQLLVSQADKMTEARSTHALVIAGTEMARGVGHVPLILAHRQADTVIKADAEAVNRQLRRGSVGARATGTSDGHLRLTPSLRHQPLVSIVILTGGARRVVRGQDVVLIRNALASVLSRTTYPNYEIVVVVDRTTDDELERSLVGLDPDRIRTVRDTEPFNFSAANNLGVMATNGEILLFLNDDTEIETPEWLERMVMYLSMDDVGVVGARLNYEDGRIQHAGLVLRDGYVEHRYSGYPGDNDGYQDSLHGANDVVAVTGACLGVRRDRFDSLGGFAEFFPLNFNDVDLCLRARRQGWRVVIDQECRLFHLETSSREGGITADEQRLFRQLWGSESAMDLFHNPAFTRVRMEHIPPPLSLYHLRSRLAPSPPARVIYQEQMVHKERR